MSRLATGSRDVWVLQAGGEYGLGKRGPLLRVDPRTGRVLACIPLVSAAGRSVLGFGVRAGRDGLVWVHSAAIYERGDRVTGLRLASGRVVTTRILPAFGSTGIAVAGGHVAIATAGGRLVVLDPFPA